jgi:hypothetical protein
MKKGVSVYRQSAAANQQRAGSALRAALAAAVRARGSRNENKVEAWNTCSVTNSRGQYSKSHAKQEPRCIQTHQTPILEPSKETDDSVQDGASLNPISSFSSDSGIFFSPNEQNGRNEHVTDDERSSALTDGLPVVFHQFCSTKMALHHNIRRSFVFFHRWLRFASESNLKATNESSTIERAKRMFRKRRVNSCFARWLDWKRNRRAKRRNCSYLDLRRSCLRKGVAWQAWLGMIKFKRALSLELSLELNSLQCCDSAGVMRNEAYSFVAAAIPHQADLAEFVLDKLSRLDTKDSPSASVDRKINTKDPMYSLPPDHDQTIANYDVVSKQIIALEEQISTEIERIENNLLSYVRNVELILHLGCSNMKDRESSWGQEKAAYESR